MRSFNSAAAPQFPQLAVRTYAAHRVWQGSIAGEVKFAPLAKKAAVQIFHRARDFERATGRTRVDAYGRRSTQGRLGRMGILVLHALLFDFLNYRTGRLDPSYAALAHKACVSVRSVARAVASLRAAGVLHWVRRCGGRMLDGHFTLEQETNAYGILPPSQWPGYRPAPEAPRPHGEAWGAAPPLPSALAMAADAVAGGLHKAALTHLESDPGDMLAVALARLGRRR